MKYLGLADAELLRKAIALSLEPEDEEDVKEEDAVDEEEMLKMAMAMSLAQEDDY